MATGKIKRKEHERLDDASIETVIGMREREKPCTIKEACEYLNIAVNGTRLAKIIEEFRERQAEDKRRRAANRGKPAQDFEISSIVEDYLAGESIKYISDRLYRSADFVKRVVDTVGVPQVQAGETYANYNPLPEQCVADSFTLGEYVWSSKYGSIAEIDKIVDSGYRIYVHQRIDENKSLIDGKRYGWHVSTGGGFYAYQPACELGSLAHLAKYGVDVKRAIK